MTPSERKYLIVGSVLFFGSFVLAIALRSRWPLAVGWIGIGFLSAAVWPLILRACKLIPDENKLAREGKATSVEWMLLILGSSFIFGEHVIYTIFPSSSPLPVGKVGFTCLMAAGITAIGRVFGAPTSSR